MTRNSPASSNNLTPKLTRDEHIARAMLMGRWYADKTHSYFMRGDRHPHIDADTLQSLKGREVYERFKARSDADR